MQKNKFYVILTVVMVSLIAFSMFILKSPFESNNNKITGNVVGIGEGGGCPSINSIGNFFHSSIVGASFSIDGGTTATYFFDSLTNRNPIDGTPGLIQ